MTLASVGVHSGTIDSKATGTVLLLQICEVVRLLELVSVRQEAHYRGYRIEGLKQGEGLLLHVSPTRPDLPVLKYSRFWTQRSPWVKAVSVVVGYIDEAFIETAHECPPKACRGFVTVRTHEPTDKAQLDESLRLRANEDSWRRAGASGPMVTSMDPRNKKKFHGTKK